MYCALARTVKKGSPAGGPLWLAPEGVFVVLSVVRAILLVFLLLNARQNLRHHRHAAILETRTGPAARE